jgi:aspartate-semialdehyde dehydrogenase
MAKNETTLKDANDIAELSLRDHHLLPGRRLHQRGVPAAARGGWNGYWIDAASTLRMEKTPSSCSTRST